MRTPVTDLPVIQLRLEDRGNSFFDPITTSSVAKSNSYCKDIRGCGDKEYRSVSSAMSIVYLDECVPVLDGVLSLKGLFYENAGADMVAAMTAILNAPALVIKGGDFLIQAALPCPGVGALIPG
jgi:hypothetical protein